LVEAVATMLGRYWTLASAALVPWIGTTHLLSLARHVAGNMHRINTTVVAGKSFNPIPGI